MTATTPPQAPQKKITRATFKSLVNKNKGKLFLKRKSSFSGMTDGCEPCDNVWEEVEYTEPRATIENNLGINGVWLVGSSRDMFTAFEDENYKGIEVYNCCGQFTLAVAK